MNHLVLLLSDSAGATNVAASMFIALVGAGILLYERFSFTSVRFAFLTALLAISMVCYALVGVTPPAEASSWYGLALAANALLGPAVYALALAIVGVRRRERLRAAWLIGSALCAWALFTPMPVRGIRAVGDGRLLSEGAWVGMILIVFMLALVLATIAELGLAYRRATDEAERARALTLAAGFAIGAAGMADFFVKPLWFSGAGFTPFAVATSVMIFGVAAIRYRAFGMSPALLAERRRSAHELELQRREFVALFDASPEAIVITDDEDLVVRINPEFTRTFGYTEADAVGRHVDSLLVPPELAAERAELAAAARRGEVVRTETVRRRSDGTPVDVSVVARELRLPGRPRQLYGSYRDLTERRRAEAALTERDEQLRHAQRLEAVGKLAGGVAHDFNNLLTVITGNVGFALDALPPGDPIRAELEEIGRAGDRAAKLTQQLLAFSRRQVLRLETVDAAAVICDVHGMLGRLIGEHIRFETAGDGDARVRADRGQLEQLLVNLVVNARDAMPEGGRILISTERVRLPDGSPPPDTDLVPGEYVRISVSDTGVGMDEDTRVRAFDPFFTTKERGKGTGLGLATVFGIVKQSGGHVAAISSPGRGTTIRVWLPAADPKPPVVAREPVIAAGPAPADDPRAPGARVLVVEDEAPLREVTARILRRAGHEVFLAADGVEALELAARHRLDVVLSDLVMPRMGGRELARRLRTAAPGLPIVLMSGYDDEVGAGGTTDRILAKPFSPAELIARVEAALAVPRAA